MLTRMVLLAVDFHLCLRTQHLLLKIIICRNKNVCLKCMKRRKTRAKTLSHACNNSRMLCPTLLIPPHQNIIHRPTQQPSARHSCRINIKLHPLFKLQCSPLHLQNHQRIYSCCLATSLQFLHIHNSVRPTHFVIKFLDYQWLIVLKMLFNL